MRVLYTQPADNDFLLILSDTIRLFGPQQAQRYLEIIRIGIDVIAREPIHPVSKAREDIDCGVRSFHLQFAAKRQGGASHVIYYRLAQRNEAAAELIVLRVLADRMDPRRRVRTALKSRPDQ